MSEAIVAHFVPRWPRNPYHTELSRALGGLGVHVAPEDALKNIEEAIRKGGRRPDIIHLHAVPSLRLAPLLAARLLLFWWFFFALRRRGVRFVWTIHDIAHHETRFPRVDLAFSRLLFRKVNAVIVHSQAALESVEKRWKVSSHGKGFVIPHGNFIRSYPNRISPESARKQLQIPDNALSFLFFGLIRPYKGVPALIDTFRSLSGDNLQLVIAGQPLSQQLQTEVEQRAAASANILFHPGFVSDDKVQVYLNAADVVVFPYTRTLTSGALILAMSFGRACIAPRLGALSDTLDAEGGFSYDPTDPRGLQNAMEDVVRHRTRLPAMGDHNLVRARAWDWEGVARQTAAVYSAALR